MAVFDLFGRAMEVGDLVVFQNPRNHPFEVIAIEESSLTGGQPMAVVRLKCEFAQPIPKPHPAANVAVDMLIVRKGEKRPEPSKISLPS